MKFFSKLCSGPLLFFPTLDIVYDFVILIYIFPSAGNNCLPNLQKKTVQNLVLQKPYWLSVLNLWSTVILQAQQIWFAENRMKKLQQLGQNFTCTAQDIILAVNALMQKAG